MSSWSREMRSSDSVRMPSEESRWLCKDSWARVHNSRGAACRGEPRRDALDTAFAGLGLFRGLYPTDEVPARDRRKVTPLSLCPRRRSENLAKIRWHSGF